MKTLRVNLSEQERFHLLALISENETECLGKNGLPMYWLRSNSIKRKLSAKPRQYPIIHYAGKTKGTK